MSSAVRPAAERVGSTVRQLAVLWTALVLLVCALTVLSHHADRRYAAIGGAAELRLPFTAAAGGGSAGWGYREGGGTAFAEGDRLVLLNLEGRTGPRFRRQLTLPPGVGAVRVAIDAHAADVRPVGGRFPRATVHVVGVNGEGRLRWGSDFDLVRLRGDAPWRRHEGIFPLHPDSTAVLIGIELLNSTGRLEVRHIELEFLADRPLFTLLRHGLLATWALLGGVGALLVWRAATAPMLALGAIATGGLAVVLLMASRATRQAILELSGASELWSGLEQSADLGHVGLFFALGLLVVLATRPRHPWLLVPPLVAAALGGEAIQLLTDQRSALLGDAGRNVVGALAGLGVGAVLDLLLAGRRRRAATGPPPA